MNKLCMHGWLLVLDLLVWAGFVGSDAYYWVLHRACACVDWVEP